MTKTELLNKLARDGEERLLLARTLDKLELARNRGVPSHTGFLSPHERAAVEGLIRAEGWPSPSVYRRLCRRGADSVRLPARLAGGGGLAGRTGV